MEVPDGMSSTKMVGGVRSMLNGGLVADAVFPARSVAVPVTVWFAPSVETVWSVGQIATPEPASSHAKRTVTGLLTQPFAFGGGLSAKLMLGAVRSIPNDVLVTDAVLPAVSVAVPLTVKFDPSLVITWSPEQLAMPDPESLHVKWAVTGPL